jgi:hypothetical protein
MSPSGLAMTHLGYELTIVAFRFYDVRTNTRE